MNLFLELFLLLLVYLPLPAALSEVHHSPSIPAPTALLIAPSLHAGGRTLAEYSVTVPRCSTAQILVLFQSFV